jgi:DeoR/GlpR family transcriptional regulator of sugar metabolism
MGQKGVATWHHYSPTVILRKTQRRHKILQQLLKHFSHIQPLLDILASSEAGVKSYLYIPSKRQSIRRVSTVARQVSRPGQAANLIVELAKNKAVGITRCSAWQCNEKRELQYCVYNTVVVLGEQCD